MEELTLERAIASREARVTVAGLGAVGLPLAAILVRAGFRTTGFDTDHERLAAIDCGESPLRHIPREVIADLNRSERFTLCSDVSRLDGTDVLILCLPTPLSDDREPDLSAVQQATQTCAPWLADDALVVLESTTYPGTTRDVVAEAVESVGRDVGSDTFLAFSPERQDPGRGDPTDTSVTKLVGGTCERSGDLAYALYAAAFKDVRRVSSAEVAEAAKLYENVFRAVNIALVNELKVMLSAMDVDVWEVIDAAATKPFGFMKFTPGPGMGGHCIPIDPFYLEWAARRAGSEARFVELAGEVNRRMPGYVVERTRAALASRDKRLPGARILLLGLAYKPDVDIVSESPAIYLYELFRAELADVLYSDPHLPSGPAEAGSGLSKETSVTLTEETLASFDAVVLATNHSAFDYDLIARAAPLVVDTRNALADRMEGRPNYFKA